MRFEGSSHCGAAPNGAKTVAINVRCLDGVDLDKVERQPFDGRSL